MRYLPEGYAHRSNPFENNRPHVTDRVAAGDLREVTIRSLLNHSSGLPNWSNGPLTLSFEPGTSWQYSGEGYALLQKVVEVVSGEGLEEFLQRQVLKPLGMDSSSFRWNDTSSDRVVPGTVAFGRAFGQSCHPKRASRIWVSDAAVTCAWERRIHVQYAYRIRRS